tara:strand:- start:41 stop:544 length:504 start_codon:yes stop_codon:yes gene_type:complete
MINKGLFTSTKPNWQTPKWLFDKLNNHFNFLCDVCAEDHNALCNIYFTQHNSCLDKDWYNINFMNPPCGREIGKFIEKAYTEWALNDCTTVALLPARTDTKWFHKYIYNKASIVFIRGRLKFEGGEKLAPAPFPSMIVVWWSPKMLKSQSFITEEDLKKIINKDGYK